MALTAPTVKDLARLGGFTYPNAAAVRIHDQLEAIITAIGSTPGWGIGVADLTALAAVAAADRTDKQARVVEDNSQGGESIYIFDATSTADADGITVVAPAAGTGRWFLSFQAQTATLQVVNKTGVSLTKGRAVYVTGWDTTTGRLSVALADSTDVAKQAIGALLATVANNAVGVASREAKLTSSGLDTSLSAVGAAVYYSNLGVLTLTPPAAAPIQPIARVRTLAASGIVQLSFEPVEPLKLGTSATTACAGNDARLSDTRVPTAGSVVEASLGAGAFGSSATTACVGNDGRLSDTRTPTDATATGIKQAVELATAPVADTRVSATASLPFTAKHTIAGNRLKVGSLIRVRVGGTVTLQGGADTLALTLRIGGETIVALAALAVAATNGFFIDADIVFSAIGGAAVAKFNAVASGKMGVGGPGTESSKYTSVNQNAALDTTAGIDVDLLAVWGSDTTSAVRLDVMSIQVIN